MTSMILRRIRTPNWPTFLAAAALTTGLFGTTDVLARDWYVSAAKGKGKKGTKEKPAKDLGNIIKKLKPGDVVHIAAGTYLGRGKSGADELKVPVSVIGGYDESFTKRDPWGSLRTILSGDNLSKNYKVSSRLSIDLSKYKGKQMPAMKIDGLIIDQGGQNRYKTDKQAAIVRKADPKTGKNPTPDRGALTISLSKTGNFDKGAHWDVTVSNNIILNSAPTKGALMVRGYKGSDVKIRNNAVINCTGSGIYASTAYRPRDNKNQPKFLIENNTVLFTWKYDGMATSFSGNALETDQDTNVTAQNNVFAFSDRFGIESHSRLPLLLKNNIVTGSLKNDYWETNGDMVMNLEAIEDEAEFLHEDSEGNESPKITIPVSKEWAQLYASRVLINRAKLESKVSAKNTGANALRSMLGLPLQAGTIKGPDIAVYLPRLSVDDAVKAASSPYEGKGSNRANVK